MRKIVIDCEKMRYPNTGFYYFCKNLASNVIEQADKDLEKINLYLPKKEVGSFGNYDNIILRSFVDKFYMADSHKIDLWHSATQMSHFPPLNKKTKILLTIHDLNFIYERPSNLEFIKKKLAAIQGKINRADEIVAISEYVKGDVLNHLNTGGKRITVIYNGCNTPSLQRNSLSPEGVGREPFLFTIGAINAKKNAHVLPALLRFNDYNLVIGGMTDDEAYKQKIINEAIRHNVLHRIIFAGPISDNDKYWYLENCEAFMFPSLAEGFGLPVVEAMYFGKPIFLSAKTSLPEIGGEAAFYFHDFSQEHMQDVFSAGMNRYKNDSSLTKKIKEQSMAFSWKKAARQYLELYGRLF